MHLHKIKILPPETLKYLLDIYNRIWEEGKVPKSWKRATITPLLKEGVRSYRLVALTSIFCKVFERMTCRYLEKKKKDDSQFGFRKQRSTIDAITKLTTKILNGFRRKEKTAQYSLILIKLTERRQLDN